MNKIKLKIKIKTLGALTLLMIGSIPAFADLVGGTIVTAHVPTDEGCSQTTCNGRKFYISLNENGTWNGWGNLNWWSAHMWCEANGLKLATLAEACPPGNPSVGPCPNLSGLLPPNYGVWVNLSYSDSPSAGGSVDNNGVTRGGHRFKKNYTYPYALCIMPEEEEN